MVTDSVGAVLLDWIHEANPDVEIDLNTELIDSGILDSMQFAELIMLLEELRGEEIEADDKTEDNFGTVRVIIQAFLSEHCHHQEKICSANNASTDTAPAGK